MSLIVHVQEHAFQAMLISSIETFPSSYLPPEPGKSKPRKNKLHDGEAMGLLFGQRVVKGEHLVFNVSLAVTMQRSGRRIGWPIAASISSGFAKSLSPFRIWNFWEGSTAIHGPRRISGMQRPSLQRTMPKLRLRLPANMEMNCSRSSLVSPR